MKKYLAAVLALSLAACAGISDSSFRFQGQVLNLNEAPATPPALQVENIASGVLAISGGTTTPCWNDVVRLDGNKNGSTLEMIIDRVAQNPCTDARTRHHAYLGVFSSMRLGTYTVRVVDATGASPVVLVETTVQVN